MPVKGFCKPSYEKSGRSMVSARFGEKQCRSGRPQAVGFSGKPQVRPAVTTRRAAGLARRLSAQEIETARSRNAPGQPQNHGQRKAAFNQRAA